MSFLNPTSCVRALAAAHEQKLLKSGRYTHCAVGTLVYTFVGIRDPRWIQSLEAYMDGVTPANVPHISFYTDLIGCEPEDLIQLEMAFEGRNSPREPRDSGLTELERLSRALDAVSGPTAKTLVA